MTIANGSGHHHLGGGQTHHHDNDSGHDVRHTAGEGATVLDIGGTIGALLLRTPAELAGAEIEISPIDDPSRRLHVAVHPRKQGDTTVYAAIYYSLEAGVYQLWAADGTVALTVAIDGGLIAEHEWPAGVPAPR